MRFVAIPIPYIATTNTMRKALKLLIVAYLTIGCIAQENTDLCQHFGKEDGFPPKVRHQYFSDEYVNQFDEIIVIGDVHGCIKELELFLNKANVTGDNVLKILAGDITRKGPDSTAVIRFVQNSPSVVSVRGNNDQKVLNLQYEAAHSNYTLNPEDAFIADLAQKDLDFLEQLPYTISVPSANAIVVHAGILPGVELEKNAPFDLMNVRNLVEDEGCAGGYRPIKSHIEGVPWASVWNGPEHVYFGHDHFRNLQLYPLATGVDTSCVSGKYLTGVFIRGPRTGEFVRQKALDKYIEFPSLEEALRIVGNPENVISLDST